MGIVFTTPAMSQNSKIVCFRNTSPEVETPEKCNKFLKVWIDQQTCSKAHRSYSMM